MADRTLNVTFSVPYEIAAVRPLRQTTPAEREDVLRAAHYNTELIPQDLIYIDLSTDSGVSALSTNQLALVAGAKFVEPGMGLAMEGSRSFARLAREIERVFGFPFVVPTTQGRAAERIWAKINIKPGSVVAGNLLFPSTRSHIEMSGGMLVDVSTDAAHVLTSSEPFKGNVDLDKLAAVIHEHGAAHISCVYVELAVNASGGQPVSLANLKAIRELSAAHKIPFFLDACRILENSYLVREREPGLQRRSIWQIVRETCNLADGCTMSALKDLLVPTGGLILTRDEAAYRKAAMQGFLDGAQLNSAGMETLAAALEEITVSDAYIESRVAQVEYLWHRLNAAVPLVQPLGGHAVFVDLKKFLPHLTPEQFPAEALAAFLYQISGVRVTKGPPPAPSQQARGVELLRLAVPARKYLCGHLDDVAEAIRYAYAHRDEVPALKRVDDVSRGKYVPAQFIRL
jgi:tyrosine phenol-lyase